MSYVLTKLITNNINNESLYRFLFLNNFHKEFTESGENYENYIEKIINTGKLPLETFNDYLFDELCYGKQRDTYIFKIHLFNKKIRDLNELIKIISFNYNVNVLYYNKIATTYFNNDDEKKELVAYKIVPNFNSQVVSKIELLFGYKIEVWDKDGNKKAEYSYVPVMIDLDNKLVVIKVSPKVKVVKDIYKPESLFIKYKRKVFSMFHITTNAFNYTHKEVLYRMCEDLYSQIYKKMVSTKPNQVDKILEDTTKKLEEVLVIPDIEMKKTQSNIFDIKTNLIKLVEHLLISNIIYSKKPNEAIEGVDGVVTYLRFNDGNVSARLRGKNCKEPIFNSETYMALRNPIDNSKKISELQVLWFFNEKDLRVAYNTDSSEFLNIHFFRSLDKKDFNYGYGKYTKYEQAINSKISKMDKIDSAMAAK